MRTQGFMYDCIGRPGVGDRRKTSAKVA